MNAGQTYPGTATPLRGLHGFTEADRDVFFGREHERDELAALVTGPSFRAGLLFGESGVGKSSLLRAGLIPHLMDSGIFAVLCEDNSDPVRSFANSVLRDTGISSVSGESPHDYLFRVVSEAVEGQLFVFVVDGLEEVLAGSDELLTAYADLYQRLVSRSGGRARFLFACAAERVFALGALENKTGSLFPPSNRYQLHRLDREHANVVLERTIAFAGLDCTSDMPEAIVATVGRGGQVLPADLQIAALAIRDLGLSTPAALGELGSRSELLRSWLLHAAELTGDPRAALRLVGALAHDDGLVSLTPEELAPRASVDPDAVRSLLTSLQQSVVVTPVTGLGELRYSLVHPIIAPAAREISAPAREAARRAYELLGSKAESSERLKASEWWQLRREGFEPGSPSESAVLARTKRFFTLVLGGVALAPVIILIILYISLSGTYYLDTARPASGGFETVVVRKGSPGLSAFFWLPASPGYGEIIGDTGLARTMVPDDHWAQVADHDISGDTDGGAYVAEAMKLMDPRLRAAIRYATSGEDAALAILTDTGEEEDAQVEALLALMPITRGGSAEVQFLEASLRSPIPAVRSTALRALVSGAERNPARLGPPVSSALASSDLELRRLAIAAVRSIAPDARRSIVSRALADTSDPEIRRDLLQLSEAAAASKASGAIARLRDPEAPPAEAADARRQIARLLKTDAKAAAQAITTLLEDGEAPAEQRVFALELAFDHINEENSQLFVDAATAAASSDIVDIKAAALPLLAKVAPDVATGRLESLGGETLDAPMRRAVALAWGEIALTDAAKASAALEPMLEDRTPSVRGAAARALGNTGRSSQATLVKMIKTDRYDVATEAAYGLANSARAGASAGVATGGIYLLWKKKGKPRREAAEVYSYYARWLPVPVFRYLSAAARARDDSSLHIIGAEGLCNAYEAGHRRSLDELARMINHEKTDVRRAVIGCIADSKRKAGANERRIATRMAHDTDATVRADAALVLSRLAKTGENPERVGESLATLAQDRSGTVRRIAIDALHDLGSAAPENAADALLVAFSKSSESAKLEILATARAIGAGSLVVPASKDESSEVRIGAIETAIATKSEVAMAINSALADHDRNVRRAALERLAGGDTGLSKTSVLAALRLAIEDEDESVSVVGLTTLARVADTELALAELGKRLSNPSEQARAKAARAGIGLAQSDASAAVELLFEHMDDPSHDVRAALVESLGRALALSKEPALLGEMLVGAERDSSRRLIALAALLSLATTEAGLTAATSELERISQSGPPLAKQAAKLGLGMLEGQADSIAFLKTLMP